jgi:hypothetical protein
VRLDIDSEIAPCPSQMEAPSFRKTRALAAQEPSYGWTVNVPSLAALGVACSEQVEYGRDVWYAC